MATKKEQKAIELEKRRKNAEQELIRRELAERMWGNNTFMLQSGIFYKIKTKDGKILNYNPNQYQLELQNTQHTRNIILKARQLGFSTDIEIQALNFALTHDNVNVGIIAQDKDTAMDIFRDKIKFAFDHLPKNIKDKFKVDTDSTRELSFNNGSRISVSTSFRGGTLQFLHLSEFGKICAKSPEKAREIVTGAIEALGEKGRLFIESTAEGNEGYFFDFFRTAWERKEQKKGLSNFDLKPYFFAWWDNVLYTLDDKYDDIVINSEFKNYFNSVEKRCGIKLTEGQQKWYIKKKETLQDDMGREYPSFWEEAFELAVEGAYYKNELELMRNQGRITKVAWNQLRPVICARDLGGFGGGDEMSTIFYQIDGDYINIINYEEHTGYSIEEYQNNFINPKGYNITEDWFPHDGKRTESNGKTVSQNAMEIGVPVRQLNIGGVRDGINNAKRLFYRVRIDEEKCSKLIKSLSNYRRQWDKKRGMFEDKPYHNWASHGADAFRYSMLTIVDEKKVKKERHKEVWNPLLGEMVRVKI